MSGSPWDPYGALAHAAAPPPAATARCYTCDRVETLRAAAGQPSICTACTELIRAARERDAAR